MRMLCANGPRQGAVEIPASKSQAQRLLICAALGREETELCCHGLSRDIEATAGCLRALGAEIRKEEESLFVRPIRTVPEGEVLLPCGESGSTLRFLLPLVGALGADARFLREGRLPDRPLAPLDEQLRLHGMEIRERGAELRCSGRLRAGAYALPGNVSSQYISGLLMALPLLRGESRIRITGPRESAPYIRMTEEVLRSSGIVFSPEGDGYLIPGGQRPAPARKLLVEGDWSNAAFFLCAGALSAGGISVRGLSPNSSQGDREILCLLRRMGADVTETATEITVRRGQLHGLEVDASDVPDLIPVLSVLAAAAEGTTRIQKAGRLRLKESDRLRSTARMLRALGGRVEELPDGLVITGSFPLSGGSVDSAADHRIAMAAAVAAGACSGPVTVEGAECVEKSYPMFWRDWESLEGEKG